MAKDLEHYFHSAEVTNFLVVLQEATRARPDGHGVYIPPVNADKAAAEYNHLVYGQRGAGKSTLLRKLQQDRVEQGRLAVWIDQEIFANLSFPDVLVSSVETVISGVHNAVRARLRTIKKETPWWRRPFNRTPKDQRDLLAGLAAMKANLLELKFAPVESTIEWTRAHATRSSVGLAGTVSVRQAGASANASASEERSVQSRETIVTSKGEFLERALPDFRTLLTRSATITNGGAIFVDDLYHLDRKDQPQVLGYLHRLTKDTNFWLKIGSIRYLTQTYTVDRRPTGMQIGNDAHLVPLDGGMQELQASSAWLQSILRQLAPLANVSIDKLFSPKSLDRIALASGCIARDYLTIVGAAIEAARTRAPTTKSGMHRVTVEDVNRAAAVLAPAKLDDMRQDAPEEAARSRVLISQLTDFCRQTGRAYFLVDTNDKELVDRMAALRHLRFVHLLEQSESAKHVPTQRYDVWLLDVSQLAAQRATQQMDFTGWQDREKRRSKALIFELPTTEKSTLLADSPPTAARAAGEEPRSEGDDKLF